MGREDAVARPKNQEYLRAANQVFQMRKDIPLNAIQNQLQEVFQREYDCFSEYGSFSERYARSIASMHIHSSLIAPTGRRLNFCTTVQHAIASGREPTPKVNSLRLFSPASDDIQVAVLVDVRQLGKETQEIADSGITVVRLNTLNECKRLCGNVRKLPGEYVVRSRESVRNWGLSLGRDSHVKRELSACIPTKRKRLAAHITLDQLERQVVEGRPHLVNHLPSKDADVSGRSLRNVQLLFALRLRDDFVRLASGVNGNATLYSSEVFRGPDELKFRRFNASDHYDKEYRQGPSLVTYIIA
jgi:hypothetical protein